MHQTRVIELLVSHVQEIFGPEELVTPPDYPHMYRSVARRAADRAGRLQERRSREEPVTAPGQSGMGDGARSVGHGGRRPVSGQSGMGR